MGCSPSYEIREGEVDLSDNDYLTPTKNGDFQKRSLNSVKFEEYDLVWSAGKQHKVKQHPKLGPFNRVIKSLSLTQNKFMQQVGYKILLI